VAEAMDDLAGIADEGLTWRLKQAAEAAARAGRGEVEDRTEYDVAGNGLRLSRAERGALDELLARIGFPQGGVQQDEGKVKK
jgi:DNA primase